MWSQDPRDLLGAGGIDLAAFDTSATPGFTGSRTEGESLMRERGRLLAELQERLYAEGRAGGRRSVLCVLQGLDTSGKGGIAKHVLGMVDPQGVQLHSFGVPTEEERAQHYLWRIRRALPTPGKIGVFDRSHYEDVLVVRVEGLVPEEVWRARYAEINAFEEELVAAGTTVVKFALMVGYEEQGLRLMARLDRPDKRWKYSPGDVLTRRRWPDFQAAYADVLRLTHTPHAPWYVVPADKKWYARTAITEILTRTMAELDPQWPEPPYQVAEQRAALAATMSRTTLLDSLANQDPSALEESLEVQRQVAVLTGNNPDVSRLRESWRQSLQQAAAQKEQLLSRG